ncbi:MAG: CrcB family protein [Aeromicrobium sp.]|nr:MAG: CrcB family protein [Aeromicrobium sp.]
MTPVELWTLLAVSLAGGLGACARYGIDVLSRRVALATTSVPQFPRRLWLINISGSLAIGVILGLVLNRESLPVWGVIFTSGFLGGYTTFSSVSFESVRLIQSGRLLAGVAHGVMLMMGAFAAALLGVSIGAMLGA